MLLLKYYKTYLRIFFVVGLAPFSSESEISETKRRTKPTKRSVVKSFFCRLVPIINLLFSLSQFSLLLKIADGTMDGKIHVILFYGYFFLTISSNTMGNIQCFFHQSEYLDIIRRIHNIEHLFMTKFSKQMDVQRFYTIFKWKTLLVYSLLICVTLISYWFNDWKLSKQNLLRTVVTMLETICTLSAFHPMLHTALIRMFVFEMTDAVKSSKKFFRMSVAVFEKCEELKKLKLVHFEVYKLVNKINLYFGWSLLFLLVKYFVDITYNLYWIFIEIQELGWESTTHIGIRMELMYSLK